MSVRCAALASPEGGGGELKSLRLQKKFFCGRWAKMALLIQKVADPCPSDFLLLLVAVVVVVVVVVLLVKEL